MTTIAENALTKTEDALKAVATSLTLPFIRNPETEVSAVPSLVMLDGPQRPVNECNEFTVAEMDVAVEAYVTQVAGTNINAAGASAGTLARSIYGAIVNGLHNDAPLAAAVMDLFEGPLDWQLLSEPGTQPHLAISLNVRLKIQYARNNPSAPAP